MLSIVKAKLCELFGAAVAPTPTAHRKLAPQFERLETRENPAAHADVIVWGNSWQEYHIGSDDHLHVIYSSNGGPVQNLDLSAAIGSTTNYSHGLAPVVATTFGNKPYVFVRSDNQVLHAFYWSGSAWAEANLSAAANYGANVAQRQIAAHVWNGVPHVFFIAGSHVHEMYWSAQNGWNGFDVTQASGTNATAAGTATVAAVVGPNNTERVYYRAVDNRLRELKWTAGAGWTDADLTGSGVAMDSFSREIAATVDGQTISVGFRGANGHLMRFTNAGAGWVQTDLTSTVGVATDVSQDSTIQFSTLNGKLGVYYRGADNHLRAFEWTAATGWTASDLTQLTGAANVGNGMAINSISGNIASLVVGNTQVVFYVDFNNKVSRMFNWDPFFGWQNVVGPNI